MFRQSPIASLLPLLPHPLTNICNNLKWSCVIVKTAAFLDFIVSTPPLMLMRFPSLLMNLTLSCCYASQASFGLQTFSFTLLYIQLLISEMCQLHYWRLKKEALCIRYVHYRIIIASSRSARLHKIYLNLSQKLFSNTDKIHQIILRCVQL